MPFSPPSHPVWAVCRATSPCQWRLGGLRAGRLPLPALPVAWRLGGLRAGRLPLPALPVAGAVPLRDAEKAAARCRKGHPATQERLEGRKDGAGDVFDGQAVYVDDVVSDGLIGGTALGQQMGNAFTQGLVCVGRGRT